MDILTSYSNAPGHFVKQNQTKPCFGVKRKIIRKINKHEPGQNIEKTIVGDLLPLKISFKRLRRSLNSAAKIKIKWTIIRTTMPINSSYWVSI